jgi:phosphatidate phosphatase APP1
MAALVPILTHPDIDDTIKITQTSDPIGILRTTFVEPATPIAGMPQLYQQMLATLRSMHPDPHEHVPFFYLSASPYNLYPFLRQFRDDAGFPSGQLILRDSSWKTIAGLLSALTVGTEAYKVGQMRRVRAWFPRRKMIFVGDSTQSDPEAYGHM